MSNPQDINLKELELSKEEIENIKQEAVNNLYSDSIPTQEDISNINAVILVTLQEIIPLFENKSKQFISDKLNRIEKVIDEYIEHDVDDVNCNHCELKQIIRKEFTDGK